MDKLTGLGVVFRSKHKSLRWLASLRNLGRKNLVSKTVYMLNPSGQFLTFPFVRLGVEGLNLCIGNAVFVGNDRAVRFRRDSMLGEKREG